ncbi:hypothetical protein PRZ48_009422 [Zasmidium cellare]|uniref:Uncharacterized protein n=1 Tax=Zasmidium cellare TaxID=395010 RepID=A0ABR0EBP8_ZASCE|nr:hypothetical protein PRZ48_009422 [Zasmidium cellare]
MSEPKMRIVLDWGTTHWKAAVYIGRSEHEPRAGDVFLVTDNATMRAGCPMVAGYYDGEFRWGSSLIDDLMHNRLPEDPAVHLHKLALYDCHQTAEITQDVWDTLGGRDKLVPFMTDFMRAVLGYIVEWTKDFLKRRRPGCTWDLEDKSVDTLRKEVQMTVPLIFTPSSTKQMMDAADDAGFPDMEFVSEPIAAAAFILALMKQGINTLVRTCDLVKGSKVLCVDVGGGTTDMVTIKIECEPQLGATAKLGIVGQPQGALCGSHLINQAFLDWVPNSTEVVARGGIDAICDDFRLSRRALFAKLSRAFDRIKTASSWDFVSAIVIAVNGDSISITIPIGLMKSFFNPVIDKVIAEIGKILTDGTEAIFLLGGFANSIYATNRIRAHFEKVSGGSIQVQNEFRFPDALHEPCACGPILRYSGIEARDFPSQYCFGIARVEVADPEQHPDAFTFRNRLDKLGGDMVKVPAENLDVVKKDIIDPSLSVVVDRWVTLLPQNTMPKDGNLPGQWTWRWHYLDPDEDEIVETIYWSDKSVADHTAIKDPRGGLNPDFHVWADMSVKYDPAANGHQLIRNRHKGGSPVYEVYSRIRLTSSGAKTEVVWEFLKAGVTPPFDDKGRRVQKAIFSNMFSEDSGNLQIRSQYRNPFVHDQFRGSGGEDMDGVEKYEDDQDTSSDADADKMEVDSAPSVRVNRKSRHTLPSDDDDE